MSTTTLQPNPLTQAVTPVAVALQGLLRRLELAAATPASADEVMELAALYECSQPSYAEDLRAAAETADDDATVETPAITDEALELAELADLYEASQPSYAADLRAAAAANA